MTAQAPATATDAARTAAAPVTCAHCGEAFLRADYLALHLGRAHGDALSDDERARFEAAVAAEEAWLKAFRKHVRGGMNALPAAVIYLGIVLMIHLAGIPIFFGLLLLPIAGCFAALLYYMQYIREE